METRYHLKDDGWLVLPPDRSAYFAGFWLSLWLYAKQFLGFRVQP